MDFMFRIAILALGYFYPAYKCFKAIDLGKPRYEQLHVWCQYWIIIAVFTGFERVADTFISWLPFYSGVKLAFVVYLWHPDTKGTEYIYQNFVKPRLSKHMESVDLNFVLVRDETVRVLTILCNSLMYQIHLKVSGVMQQNAALSPNTDALRFYPPISSSLCGDKMHQPLATRSAIWPQEQYQKKASHNPGGSVVDRPLGRADVLPSQLSIHYTLPSQPAPKPLDLGAVTKSSTLLSTADPKNYEGKEETDFELVHSSEIPVPESSGAPADLNKRNKCAQGQQSRFWWW